MTHGQLSSYTLHGCRCEVCRAAWRDYHRRYTAARRKAGRCVNCGGKSERFRRCLTCRERHNDWRRRKEAAA